jgi:hypothetical protein
MAKQNSDLFDRLRQAGLRKQVAKTLSEIGDGAGKKAHNTARTAVSELRALADEIERRLPSATPVGRASRATAKPASTRAQAATPRATRSRAASSASSAAPARTAAAKPKPASPRAPAAAAKAKPASGRAPAAAAKPAPRRPPAPKPPSSQ